MLGDIKPFSWLLNYMQVRIHNVNRPHLNIHNAVRSGGQLG